MKLDFTKIKSGWGRLGYKGRLGAVCVGLLLLLAGVSGAQKFGGSTILPPSNATFTSIASNAVPSVNNTYNLGSPSKSWSNIYASGTASLKYVSSTAITVGSLYATLFNPTNISATFVTSSNFGLPAGGNIKVAGTNPKRTIVLSGAGAWAPTTGGSIGTYQNEMSTNKQNFQYVYFASSTVQGVSWTVVMPDNYDGSTITAEYYQTATTTCAGNVVWALAGTSYNNGDALDAAWGTAVSSTVALDGTANHVSTSTASSAITFGGSPRGGSMVQLRVRHDGTSASDTAGCAVDLVMVKLKYGIKSYSD